MKNNLLWNKMSRYITFQPLITLMSKCMFLLLALATIQSCQLLEDFLGDHDNVSPHPQLALVAEGLTQPVAMAPAPDGSNRIFIVDQIGLIRVVTADGQLQQAPFLDLRDKIVPLNPGYDERGLLGLAFHPDYANNGRFFVYYSGPLQAGAPAEWNHTSYISQFKVSAESPLKADKNSEQIILAIDQPQGNHNGGTLAFGPTDHYLYISTGDGGGRDDEALGHVEDWYEANAGGNGQDIKENLLGNILRINVDGATPYSIPADNPFVGKDGLDEIYAYGFRNPYRFSFDKEAGHDLFVGDAGQELWEEVSIVEKGGNYGWNVKEGTHCFDAENPETPMADCPDTDPEGNPLIDPVIEIKNAKQPGGLGYVIVGGYAYRGDALPKFYGKYIFGTWSVTRGTPDGLVFVATPKESGLWSYQQLKFANTPSGQLKHYLLSFGQDTKGEIYLLTSDATGPTGSTGKVYKLISSKK